MRPNKPKQKKRRKKHKNIWATLPNSKTRKLILYDRQLWSSLVHLVGEKQSHFYWWLNAIILSTRYNNVNYVNISLELCACNCFKGVSTCYRERIGSTAAYFIFLVILVVSWLLFLDDYLILPELYLLLFALTKKNYIKKGIAGVLSRKNVYDDHIIFIKI